MRQQINQKTPSNPQECRLFCLQNYLNHESMNKRITCLPLQFQYLPVEILSKQFTKLNNPHPYRIHYLGPRFKNTLQMHKKNASSDKRPFVYNSNLFGNDFPLQSKKQQVIKKKYSEEIQPKSQPQNTLNEENVVSDKQVSQTQCICQHPIQRYKVDMRRIAHSYLLQEKLKNTQYFKSAVFYRAFQGMNPSLNLNEEFVFNSCFQNGNLDCAIKITQRQFDLFLRIDSNTRGHLLWFYFSVKNNSRLGKIKMNICNFSKSKTLYKEGLRPYIFSSIRHKNQNKGWQQNGVNLGLEKAQLRYEVLQNKYNSNNTNCLNLQYQFEQKNDEVFFSYCIPYTYSQLLSDIERLPQKYVQKKYLGKSLLGTNIPVLHITDSHIQSQFVQQKFNLQCDSTTSVINSDVQIIKEKQSKIGKKKVIFATGRIHPSQSNSSYVMMGFINWLCSEQKEAVQLRKIARFIIVPMVNPDGVIIGNSRTSASGNDLNRQYICSDPTLHPQIFLIQQLAKQVHYQHPISLFLDFHGHSRKKNTFFYGPVYNISQPNYYKCRILPKLIQKISNPFRYHSCSFNIIQDKKKTARASMFQSLGIEYTYTVQSSIGYFYDSQKLKIFQFSQDEWRKMGSAIAQGTSLFITGIDHYEQVLAQKRKLRLRKKKLYRHPHNKLDYLEDQMFLKTQIGEQPSKIPHEDRDETTSPKVSIKVPKSNIFLQMLEQLRKTSIKPQKGQQKTVQTRQIQIKDLDIDQDSDSHDEKQDMDKKKLKQFRYLVKQQIKNHVFLNRQKHDYEIKFSKNHQDKLNKNIQLSSDKIINQFELLGQTRKARNTAGRNVKTGEGTRNISPHKYINQLVQQNHRQKTLQQQSNQNKQLKEAHYLNSELQTPFFNQTYKRAIYISAKNQKKDVSSIQKRQKTIGNYFGECRLIINESSQQTQKKRQKLDVIRKLQTKRQNQRKQRSESTNQIKSNISIRNSVPSNNLNGSMKADNTQPQIHKPRQFAFRLPFSQGPEISKSHILKPKLKLHFKPKPSSLQGSQNSLAVKQRQSSINIREKSQKMMQGLFNLHIKQTAREKKVSQSLLIQQVGPFSHKKNYITQKNPRRESNRCTRIDLNDVNNTTFLNYLKIDQQM